MRKLLALSALIVLFDQGTKLAVKGFDLFGIQHRGMYLGESIPVLGDFLRFTFVENPGMAFGLDFGVPLLLGLFSIGAAFFLVHLLRKSRNGKIGGFHIALAMILGGAVGNLIDRVFYGVFYGYAHLFKGKVVDFIDVDIPDITLFGRSWDRFYVFNIADAAVSCGIVLLLLFYPKQQKEQEETEAKKRAQESGDGVPVLGYGESLIPSATAQSASTGVFETGDASHHGSHSTGADSTGFHGSGYDGSFDGGADGGGE